MSLVLPAFDLGSLSSTFYGSLSIKLEVSHHHHWVCPKQKKQTKLYLDLDCLKMIGDWKSEHRLQISEINMGMLYDISCSMSYLVFFRN